MTTLYYSVIVILSLMLIPMLNVSGLVTSESKIQLLTGKPTYVPGEKIQIIGAFNPNDLIHIDLVNPLGDIQNSTLLQSDNTGHFRTNYIVPYNAVNGTWKILATRGLSHTSLDIQVISSNYGTKNTTYTNGPGGPVTPTQIESPLKQFKSGVAAKDVTCKKNLQLIVKAEDNSPICVKSDTAMTLVKRGWAMLSLKNFGYNPGRGPISLEPKESEIHDNSILPKNMSHTVIPPLNETGKLEQTHENKTSSPLQLFLSIDSEYQNPAEPITIDVGLNNTGSVPLTLAKSDNWPRNDMTSGLCSNLPFGISILKGYYTEQNMSSANSLGIYGLVPCPRPTMPNSYTFDPLSSKAIPECDSLFSCPGLTDMKAHLVIPDFMNNGQHHSFDVGQYTIVAGDEWGHVTIKHFTEEYATAYSAPLEH